MPDRYYIGGEKPYPSRRTSGPGCGSAAPKRSWPKWLRIAGWTVLAALIVAAVGGLLLYRAVKHVPEFYREAMQVSLDDERVESDKMVRQVAGLASDVQKEGRWTAVFTAEQINGWLAVELAKQHAGLLPPELSDPRVSIKKDGVTVACRFRSDAFDTVASLAVDVYPVEPNVVAVQIRGVRAGSLPLPLGRILDEVSRAATRLEWEVRWRHPGGDPVVLVTIPAPRNRGEKLVTIDVIQLDEGEIRLSGVSRRP